MNDILDKIHYGDARDLIASVPDGSVDAIICDPVYWFPRDYAWLMMEGVRVLKPGGSIVAQTGAEYRFMAELSMHEANEAMKNYTGEAPFFHRPLLVERFTGGYRQAFNHRALFGYHAYLWWTLRAPDGWDADDYHKQSRRIVGGDGWLHTMLAGKREKARHAWGDGVSIFLHLIENLVPRGGVVLDPFAGSGTVEVAAIVAGRHFIGFEYDKMTYNAAVARLKTVQRPLLYAAAGAVQQPLVVESERRTDDVDACPYVALAGDEEDGEEGQNQESGEA